MDIQQVSATVSVVNTVATLGLVGVTIWRAISTARMLRAVAALLVVRGAHRPWRQAATHRAREMMRGAEPGAPAGPA